MPNRRFGTANKFGTSNTFGASTGLESRQVWFGLQFDWDNDRHFDGTNEAGALLAWNDRRGREFFINSGGDGFQAVDIGEIVFTMLNIDRRYDPYYADGDLFTSLQKNPMCKFQVVDESTGTIYDEFFGYVTDIKPQYGAVDKVQITVKDSILFLKDKTINSSVVYQTVQYDAQIDFALRQAKFPEPWTIDETLSDTIPYHWFSGKKAFDEIKSLVDATFGLFYINKAGAAIYKSRISSDTPVMELTEADIDLYYGIQSPSPREVVKNRVRVYAQARKAQASVELWRMQDVPQLAASATGRPIWATYSYDGKEVPATVVTAPVATTDYTAFQNADGSGTDFTANISWTREGFATSSKLTPTNSGAAAYLTLMKLRGTAMTTDEYTYAESEDEDSQQIYGVKDLEIKLDWLQDLNTAAEIADLLVGRLSTLRFFPRVKIKKSNIAKQMTPDIFDLVSINFATKGVSGYMRVGYIEKSWSVSAPNIIETVMYFEPDLTVSSSDAWIFTTAPDGPTFPMTFG